MLNSAPEAHLSCFRVIPPGLVAFAKQPAAPVKPFHSVVEGCEVKLKFTISLASYTPNARGGCCELKPSHVLASWAFWSQYEKDGKVIVSTPPNEKFVCNEAAVMNGATVSDLRVQWREATVSTAEITKNLKMKQKPVGKVFDDQFIQITLFAANQKYHKAKDGQAPQPQKPYQVLGTNSKPIILDAFLVNLSVCWRSALRYLFF
jgi:hypothetical protein